MQDLSLNLLKNRVLHQDNKSCLRGELHKMGSGKRCSQETPFPREKLLKLPLAKRSNGKSDLSAFLVPNGVYKCTSFGCPFDV